MNPVVERFGRDVVTPSLVLTLTCGVLGVDAHFFAANGHRAVCVDPDVDTVWDVDAFGAAEHGDRRAMAVSSANLMDPPAVLADIRAHVAAVQNDPCVSWGSVVACMPRVFMTHTGCTP